MRAHDLAASALAPSDRSARRRGRRVGARTAAAAAARTAERRAGLPLQERRRADQRHRDGVRRERPLRARPAAGRLSSSTRTTSRSDVTHFSAERVPVSLGIALDTSGSMAGEKIRGGAERARSLPLRPARPRRTRSSSIASATTRCCCRAGRPIASCCRARSAASSPNGGTAMYDAVAEAIPLAQQGQNRKKALAASSRTATTRPAAPAIRDVKQQIRESEVLVYAIGIDGERATTDARRSRRRRARRCRCRFRFPARPAAGGGWPLAAAADRRRRRRLERRASDDRVNVAALRDMTDDSGGRTEIIRDARDLEPGDGEHRRRVEQAVLPRLSVDRKEGRPLALDPRRSAQPRTTASARAAATSQARS